MPGSADTADLAAEGMGEVKDIRSGEQHPADPAIWAPPAEDLRPAVLRIDPAA
jgi:histidyl-tRNA synthetase